jgi:hypothetical protein
MLDAIREMLCPHRGLRRLLFVVITALAGATAASAQVNIYYVPFNSTDATANIQNTIDNAVSPSKIILTHQATPWYVNTTIVLDQPNMQIWFANGAKVMAKSGGFVDTHATPTRPCSKSLRTVLKSMATTTASIRRRASQPSKCARATTCRHPM